MPAQTLDEQIEELNKQLEVAEAPVVEEPEEEVEQIVEELLPEVEAPPAVENDPQLVARAHFEAREARRIAALESQKNADLQRQIDELKSSKQEQRKPEDPEPNPEEEPIAHLQWQNRELARQLKSTNDQFQQFTAPIVQQQAVTAQEQGFQTLESQFAPSVSDYNDVSSNMVRRMTESAMLLSPTASPQQINSFVKQQILTLADNYAKQGVHPIESLYNLGKSPQFGYQPKQAPVIVPKVDLETIERNKKKSVNGLGGTSGKAYTTAEAAANMSIAELEKMDKNERFELLGW